MSLVEIPLTYSQGNWIPFSFCCLADCHPFLQPAHKRHLLPQRGMCQQAAERPRQLWGKLNFKFPRGSFPGNGLHQSFSFFSHSWLLCQKTSLYLLHLAADLVLFIPTSLTSVREWRSQTWMCKVQLCFHGTNTLTSDQRLISTGLWSQLRWIRHYFKDPVYPEKLCWCFFCPALLWL